MAEENKKYFHFTLGPVQGFVAQARRTRDFWAGSFLLSWLAGVAMAEVKRQKGEINFPTPAKGYLDWITTGQSEDTTPPRQGGIPNRFKAFKAEVPADFDGALVVATVRAAWLALADHIWEQDQLADIPSAESRAIWMRQHSHFWDMSWALTKDEKASDLIDKRKNWRAHFTPDEPGVKCMVMDGWQELSGVSRPGQLNRGKNTTPLNQYWTALRTNGQTGMTTDLAEGEHLCGLAYVKRRFVRHFEQFKATLPSGLTLKGWKLEAGVPSVSYMAAVHWLETLVTCATTEELEALHHAAEQTGASRDEWDTRIACLDEAWKGRSFHRDAQHPKRKLLALDGNLFFEHVHQQPERYGYKPAETQQLSQMLKGLKKKYAELAAAPLSPFYAVLLMDGDSLGVHMSDPKKQASISKALEAFTNGVPKTVEEHNGFLIYAGGDDVLAILPLEDAIPCAAAVRTFYLKSFAEQTPVIPTTISAAIEFAHIKTPLGQVLGDAHGLLDHVAKDGAGRDALAVRIWKPGAMVAEWAQPWAIALDDQGQLVLAELAKQFSQQESSEGEAAGHQFSNKFFFKIRERFELFNPNGKDACPLSAEEAVDVLAVDYLHSAKNRKHLDMAGAKEIIRPLLKQCRAVTRTMENNTATAQTAWPVAAQLKEDGAMLLRFLVQKGVGV